MKNVPGRWIVVLALLCCSVSWAGPRETGKLRLLDHIARDPLFVFATGDTSFAEVYDGWMSLADRFAGEDLGAESKKELAELGQKLGCSVMDDVLARIGPEYAVVLDLPPIDELMGSMAMGPRGIGDALGDMGILTLVDGPEILDGCLRKLLADGEARTFDEDGLVRVEYDTEGPDAPFMVYYGFQGDLFAMGTSPDFVRASLKPRPEGTRLTDGEDFAAVFKHLDSNMSSLSYLNLPRARGRVESSVFLQSMVAADPEAGKVIATLLDPEFTGIGIGSTSIRTSEGTRTTQFGPSVLSSGLGGGPSAAIIAAIAVPNFFNAVDRGKQKRTMADIRSVGTVIEEYSIDNNVYPGPTDGWVPLAQLSDLLSPTYIRMLPSGDGWEHTIMVWSDGEHYRIVSPGKDGELERDWRGEIIDGGPTTTFDADIVYGDGRFLTWPEGAQQ